MTDFAERFARTQGWTKCAGVKGVCSFNGECDHWIDPATNRHADLPTLDTTVLPIIWAECKANGWGLQHTIEADGTSTAHIYVSEIEYVDGLVECSRNTMALRNLPDPITAIVTAFCEAVEATETPATPRNRAEQ